jgi:ankyrin repeat protein
MSGANDINAIMAAYPDDPLFLMRIALCRIDLEETQELVRRLGKVEIDIGDGLTLLHQAASFNRDDLVEYLCDAGHSTEVKTIHGETPLDQAAWKGNIDSALELLRFYYLFCFVSVLLIRCPCRFKADVDCQTHGKYTPLHRCAHYGHSRLASLLVLAGADQSITDENGQTAYEVAVSVGNEEVMKILEPMFSEDGRNISGIAYATNNPKHPNFRPEAREALFSLYSMERSLGEESEGNEEEEDE